MELVSDPKVQAVFAQYPPELQPQMLALRALVLQIATEIEGLATLEETLKWGEPSYIAKQGSTLRMDWKAKSPEQYALYFKCTTLLLPTFKTLFGNTFTYEGNRAIVFKLQEPLPITELKQCIAMALRYHKIKHLPFLGQSS